VADQPAPAKVVLIPIMPIMSGAVGEWFCVRSFTSKERPELMWWGMDSGKLFIGRIHRL
jgi:hypothetical protein